MMQFFRNIVCYCFVFFAVVVTAQNANTSRKNVVSQERALVFKEDQQIKSLYAIYNKGEEKLAYKKAHQLAKRAKFPKTKSNSYLLIAYYFNKQSVLDSSLYFTKKALQYNSAEKDSLRTRLVILSYNLMASIYRRKGLLSESKKYRIKGMEASLKYNEQELYFNHKHGLALIYSQEGNYTKALQLFEECLSYKKDPELIYGSYINIGDIYAELKKYELSNQYLKKAATLCEKEGNNNCTSIVSLSLGSNYIKQNQLENALKYYQSALTIAKKNDYQQTALEAKIAIANIYQTKKQFETAKLLFTEALASANKLNLLQEQVQIYEALKEIAISNNEYKTALGLASKREFLKDSINHLQNRKEISELEIKFNTLQKEKEIKLLQFKNEASQLRLNSQEEAIKYLNLQREIAKNLAQKKLSEIALLKKQKQLKALEIEQEKEIRKLILIAFSLLFLLACGLLFQYYKRLKTERVLNKKQQEVNAQKLETILKEQELKLTVASIEGQDKERKRIAQELHDSIGGNLAAIKLQMNSNQENSKAGFVQSIIDQLDETYQQVRNLSHNLIPKKFSQNQFCRIIEDYLDSISDFGQLKIEVTFYPRDSINQLDENLQVEIFTMTQELLTNTIKHANASKIDLQLNLIENHLNFIFEDNGSGFNTIESKKGIGLVNLENRVHHLNGSIEIDSRLKRGTIVNIEIPIQNSTKKGKDFREKSRVV